MPLIVSILQGWSHICEVGKSGFCETLLTQCNSCARRLVISAKLFFLSPLSFYSSRFSSHRASHRIFFAACPLIRVPFRGSCSCQKRLALRALKAFPMQSCSGLALCT